MKPLRNAAILAGLALYAAAFYATSLPSLTPDDAGDPFTRIKLFWVLLFRPDEWLLQNWFGVPAQFSVGDRFFVLLGAGAIVAWAAALGWLLLTACRATRGLTRLESAAFSTAVGLNGLSTWTLLLGLLGRLDRMWTFWVPAAATFACVACVLIFRLRALLRRLGVNGYIRSKNPPVRGPAVFNIVGRRWLWWAMPFVAAILLAAMLPPLDFDVCEYHLQAPKEFYEQGRIAFLPHNVYANMALGTEMLSLLGMTLVGDWWWGALVGKTVIALFTPICAAAIYAAGRRFHSTAAGVVGALVYLSIPWIFSVSSSGQVEGASACYLFLALYALLLSGRCDAAPTPSRAPGGWPWAGVSPYSAFVEGNPTALIAVSGYLAGGAVATKYPAVLFVLLPLAFWTFLECLGRRRNPKLDGTNPKKNIHSFRRAAFATAVFLLASAIGCGLWFGKNWAFTGNPTYPLLYDVFGGKTWNPDKDRQWNAVHRPDDFSAAALGGDLDRIVLTSEWLSPLVVPLALLAFVGGGVAFSVMRGLRWRLLAYAAFVVAVWWLFTHRIDRFWIPILPVLALLAGAGACWTFDFWWRSVLKFSLVFAFVANFLIVSAGPTNAWFVPLEQLRNDTNWITPWHWFFNNDYGNAPRGAVLTVGDAAVFDLKPPVLYNTCFDDCIFEQLVAGKTPEKIRAAFAEKKIAYVFVHWGEIDRYRSTYGFTDFVQPEVFDRLVKEGVLEPLGGDPTLRQETYRVVP